MATTPTQVTEYQTGFAPQVAPYAERLLGAAESVLFDYKRDPVTNEIVMERDEQGNLTGMPVIEGFKPYMQYQGERVAQFSPLQQQAFSQAQQMRSAPQLEDAAAMAGTAGLRALGYSYTPGQFTNQFVRPEQFQPSAFTAPGVSTRDLQQYQLGPAERVQSMAVQSPTINAAQLQYAPQLQAYQMGPAQAVRTATFAQPGYAEAFMSPYMQNVVARQQQAAQREADIQNQAQKAQFAQAGAFGGGRFGVQQARMAEALARQKGDIQATGLQAAYQQAQQQFNAEQAARLQANLANQQAGMQVGQQNLASALGTQQLGVQTGLQTALANLTNAQQAAVLNAANNLQAQGMTAQQALQAALANQQAGITLGQQNLAAQLGVQQLGASQDLQAQLANQQAKLQAQQLAEQSKQYGYGQQMQSSALGAQYGQAAQQLNEQSAQFGAGLGLQGLQTALQGAQQLGVLGQTQFGQNMALNQLLGQYGGMQQQQAQNILSNQYQDFLNAQNYPYRQMGFMSDILRGVPLTQTGASVYAQPPSTVSQIAGLGTAALGASKLGLFAKGGAVEDAEYREKPAGLADLAIYNMGV